ncbi:hypothetical protein [uncultured Serinicoccus sp.]|uniref:hypothetical protein n=1 Tax=uncultured Serinicoccus sp. TaxID=735514 RepID=UPI00262EDBE9|nr:hypothetical protein [uncultured Serinicoccus sp.]
MGKQTARQKARRAAREGQQRLAAERREREKRLGDLGVTVAEELAQRDILVRARDERIRAAEVRAGKALRSMVEVEGLTVGEALRWCGAGLEAREAARLRQLAQDQSEKGEQAQGQEPAGQDAVVNAPAQGPAPGGAGIMG